MGAGNSIEIVCVQWGGVGGGGDVCMCGEIEGMQWECVYMGGWGG